MAKIPKEIREVILKECGVRNIVLAAGSGIAGGFTIFTIVLSYLTNKNNEEVL